MSESDDDTTLAAMVLPSLIPGPSRVALTDRDKKVVQVAKELQLNALHTPLATMSAMWNKQHEAIDRLTEIIGRTAAAGEQIGLALAASRDARRWSSERAASAPVGADEAMAVRAHAEMVTYWSLGAAHGLGNVLLRVLWLHPGARTFIDGAYKRANSFPPFSESQQAWEPLGLRLVDNSRTAASAVRSNAVDEIVDILERLVQDARWDGLMALRSVNFHQWRPQTVAMGTAKHSLVRQDSAGHGMISAGSNPTNVAPDHEEAIAEADAGLDALAEAAAAIDARLFEALNDALGVELFDIRGSAGG